MSARRSIVTLAALIAVLAAALPTMAGAYATPAAPPKATGVSGLPDGRVFEQVSPANKYGNEVIGNFGLALAFAETDGQAIVYSGTGALGEEASNGSSHVQVSRRTTNGWTTRSATPIGAPGTGEGGLENTSLVANQVTAFAVARADLAHFAFITWGRGAFVGSPDRRGLDNNFFMEGPNPLVEPEWVARSLVAGAVDGEVETEGFNELFPVGASPDLKTLYFFYEGGLFPGASRLYEYRDGVLSDAGVLPAGESPGGEGSASWAIPAAQPFVERKEFRGYTAPSSLDNQVSADGSHLLFTRRDAAGTLELYVRVTAPDGSHRTLLVSRSQLPEHMGEAAPEGPLAMPSTVAENAGQTEGPRQESPPSYAFASPDGSHVFFQSADRLTSEAPEGSTVKTYAFDVEREALEYLPGVSGSIITVSRDGSSFTFENTSTSPYELDRWSAATGGGSVTPLVQLPAPSSSFCGPVVCVGPAYTSGDGSVVVFSTESPIAGFNDGGSHRALNIEHKPEGEPIPNEQVFRYDAGSGELDCLSCPPSSVTPSSNAVISYVNQKDNAKNVTGGLLTVQDDRGASADGSRVFFDTSDPLVPQDVNGTRDVYEWENGTIFLISSGRSSEDSYFLDASETGGDVFFTTTEGIAPGDVDGGRDVYDARIPRPGDNPPPAAVPCEGDVCQGPPSVPDLLGNPSSATFSGLGNVVPQSDAKPKAKPTTKKTTAKKKKKKKGKRARKARRSSGHVKYVKGRGE